MKKEEMKAKVAGLEKEIQEIDIQIKNLDEKKNANFDKISYFMTMARDSYTAEKIEEIAEEIKNIETENEKIGEDKNASIARILAIQTEIKNIEKQIVKYECEEMKVAEAKKAYAEATKVVNEIIEVKNAKVEKLEELNKKFSKVSGGLNRARKAETIDRLAKEYEETRVAIDALKAEIKEIEAKQKKASDAKLQARFAVEHAYDAAKNEVETAEVENVIEDAGNNDEPEVEKIYCAKTYIGYYSMNGTTKNFKSAVDAYNYLKKKIRRYSGRTYWKHEIEVYDGSKYETIYSNGEECEENTTEPEIQALIDAEDAEIDSKLENDERNNCIAYWSCECAVTPEAIEIATQAEIENAAKAENETEYLDEIVVDSDAIENSAIMESVNANIYNDCIEKVKKIEKLVEERNVVSAKICSKWDCNSVLTEYAQKLLGGFHKYLCPQNNLYKEAFQDAQIEFVTEDISICIYGENDVEILGTNSGGRLIRLAKYENTKQLFKALDLIKGRLDKAENNICMPEVNELSIEEDVVKEIKFMHCYKGLNGFKVGSFYRLGYGAFKVLARETKYRHYCYITSTQTEISVGEDYITIEDVLHNRLTVSVVPDYNETETISVGCYKTYDGDYLFDVNNNCCYYKNKYSSKDKITRNDFDKDYSLQVFLNKYTNYNQSLKTQILNDVDDVVNVTEIVKFKAVLGFAPRIFYTNGRDYLSIEGRIKDLVETSTWVEITRDEVIKHVDEYAEVYSITIDGEKKYLVCTGHYKYNDVDIENGYEVLKDFETPVKAVAYQGNRFTVKDVVNDKSKTVPPLDEGEYVMNYGLNTRDFSNYERIKIKSLTPKTVTYEVEGKNYRAKRRIVTYEHSPYFGTEYFDIKINGICYGSVFATDKLLKLSIDTEVEELPIRVVKSICAKKTTGVTMKICETLSADVVGYILENSVVA